jgi:hypothetical protein
MSVEERFDAARRVADAVLYEGYLLYPYRRSATKNQIRWQFGVLVPPAMHAADPSERSSMRTEVVVDPGQRPVLHARIRFLQIQQRTSDDDEGSWDEAVEREIVLDPVPLLPLAEASRVVPFRVESGHDVDGSVNRLRHPVDGLVRVVVDWAAGAGAFLAVAVTVENTTAWNDVGRGRDEAVRHSLVAVHTLLAVDDGELISAFDPPEHASEAVRACESDGTFPVLVGAVGAGGAGDVVLSSPIILYDHPVVAPESRGDLFDATEIDEILALRVLTLTDDEKAEARATDARAAAIVDRIEDFSPDTWAALHGTMRDIRAIDTNDEPALPWWEPAVDEGYDPYAVTLHIGGHVVTKGSAVVLHPNRRADAHDMFLAGMQATVTGVFTDVDDSVLVQVTVDDDPATEVLSWQRRGLFFHPDELEVVS